MSKKILESVILVVGLMLLAGCGLGVIVGPVLWITDLTLPPRGIGDILIRFRDIPDGLQGIEVSARAGDYLTYDPTVIQVVTVEAVAPFSLDAVAIDNDNGRLSFIVRAPVEGPFPTDGAALKVRVQHIGGMGTVLELGITNIANGNAQPVTGVTILGGVVKIGSAIAP